MSRNIGKQKQCPKCGIHIENNYTKSIKIDTFKQALVDTIHPKYAENDLIIAKRVTQLFPSINFNDIIDEYNYERR